MSGIQILGMGSALPALSVTNDDLAEIVDTSDEWIKSRTGISSRRYCTNGESVVTLAVDAAEQAMKNSGISKEKIGLVIVATVSPEEHFPSTACRVQEALQLPSGIPAFDVSAACTGFIYILQIANALMQAGNACTGEGQAALLIGAEQFSKMLDFEDRSTCVLFGDAAAAAVVCSSEKHRFFSHTAAAGEKENLSVRAIFYNQIPGKKPPFGIYSSEKMQSLPDGASLRMDGQKVFRFAVKALSQEIDELEKQSGLSCEEVDHIVCHQANERIIEHVRKKRNLPESKFFMNLQQYGNTSGASIPLALCEMWQKGILKPGDRVFAVGFGAGLTWGGVYLEI